MAALRVVILAFADCMGAEVFALHDTLRLANRLHAASTGHAAPLFDVRIVGLKGTSVLASGGVRIGTERLPQRFGLLMVPGVDLCNPAALHTPLQRWAPEVAFIRKTFARGTPVAAACVGTFLLGEAGLLDQRRVTTAWALAAELARRFPHARVEPAEILITDSGVTTSGAFSAAFDLALHVVRTTAGPKTAHLLAKTTLLDAGRRSQAPYMDPRLVVAAPQAIDFATAVRDWMLTRLHEPFALQRLAEAFGISTRTLLRRFKAKTAQTPLECLLQLRMATAKQMLASSTLASEDIAARVGYADAGSFARVFRRHTGMSPTQYRQSLGQTPGAPTHVNTTKH